MKIGKYVYVKDHRVKRLKIISTAFITLMVIGGLLIFNSLTSDNPSQTGQNNQTTVLPGENDSRAVPVDKNTRGETSERDPKSPWEGMLVAIDAGHGGIDPGTSGNGLVEKDVNLDIALKLNEALKKAGIETYMTRTTDEYNDLKEVIQTINRMNPDIVVSIHCDWFEDSSTNGTTTLYYSTKTKKQGNMTDMEFAQIIHGELMKAIGSNDRGIIQRTNLGLLKQTKMPSVIIEMGFLSSPKDAALLSSDEFRQKAAEGIAEGVKKALAKLKVNKGQY